MTEQNFNKKSEQKLKIAVGVLSLITLALACLYYFEYQKNHTNKFLKNEALEVATMKLDSVSKELDNKIAEIKLLGGNVTELEKAKTQLEADKAKLEDGVLETKNYEVKLKSYKLLIGQKTKEIENLKIENGNLAAKNDSLSKETTVLKLGLGSAQKALEDTTKKHQELLLKTREIESRNKELAEKVSLASALKAENVNIYGISTKGRESYGQNRTKKIDKIRVTFFLQENPFTSRDAKIIYLKIIEPNGQTIYDLATGSGSFTFRGKEQYYTAKQKILFDNSHQTVEFVYSRSSVYREGKHSVELYSEGYKIGEGAFEAK